MFLFEKIEIIGWFLILVGVFAFFLKPRWLYFLTIFFIPFSAMSILNFQSKKLSLLASMFFGTLWIINEIMSFIFSKKKNIKIPTFAARLMTLFIVTVIISLFMPLYLEGKLRIFVLDTFGYESVEFRKWHFLSLIYVLFGSAITTLVIIRNQTLSQIQSTLKTYMISGFVVCLIGFAEIILYKLSLPNPLLILNNSASGKLAGQSRILSDSASQITTFRMSSVAEEPSFLSNHLLAMVPIVLFAILLKYKVISPKMDKIILLSLISILLLSTSATAYFGLVGMFIIVFFILLAKRAINVRYGFIIMLLVFVSYFLYKSNPLIQNFAKVYIFNKLETGSGIWRIETLKLGFGYFLKYPIFGIGFGIFPVYDFVIKVLSGVGAVGFLVLSLLLFYSLSALFRIAKFKNKNIEPNQLSYLGAGLLTSNLTYLMASEISGFHFQLVDFWFLIGLAIALPPIFWKEIRTYYRTGNIVNPTLIQERLKIRNSRAYENEQ